MTRLNEVLYNGIYIAHCLLKIHEGRGALTEALADRKCCHYLQVMKDTAWMARWPGYSSAEGRCALGLLFKLAA